MKNNFRKLWIGHKVWSLSLGKGTIVSLAPHIEVSFSKEDNQYFNHGGVNINFGRNRDLFLKKPVITRKKRLSYLNAESFGKGISEGEHLERLFSENINLYEVVEKVLSIASDYVMKDEGSDFGIYMLKDEIIEAIKKSLKNKNIFASEGDSICESSEVKHEDCKMCTDSHLRKYLYDKVDMERLDTDQMIILEDLFIKADKTQLSEAEMNVFKRLIKIGGIELAEISRSRPFDQ